MLHRIRSRLPHLAPLAALALAALGSAANAASPVKFCTSAGVNAAIQPVLYAETAGLFEKNGVKVELLHLQDDTTAVQALIAQSCDMLYAGAGTGIVAISRRGDIKVVMSHTPWTDYVLVAQPAIKTMKDLTGKSMGTSKIGALNFQAATFALRQAGVDPNSIQFVSTGGSDSARAQALAARSISAAVMNGTWATTALQSTPDLHVLYDVGAVFRDKFMSTAVFARGPVMKNNSDGVQRVVKALIEASRALQADKSVALNQAVKSGLKVEVMTPVYDKIFSANKPYYGVNGGIDRGIVESTVQILKESGDMTDDLSFEQIVDMQFLNKALQELGEFKS